MKKLRLLAVVFLIGMTAQASEKEERDVTNWDNNRYLSTQTVRFVEDGISFFVFLDGSFEYKLPHYYTSYRGRNSSRIGERANRRNRRQYTNNNFLILNNIQTDRYGRIVQIGNTNFTYKRNGKIRTIGNVKLKYAEGRLIQAGGMHIFYNRRSQVVSTQGAIQQYNASYTICGVSNYEELHYNNLGNTTYYRRRSRH